MQWHRVAYMNTKPEQFGDYLTYQQVGRYLIVDVATVRRLVESGELPVTRVSERVRRISKVHLDRYLESQTQRLTDNA